MHDTYEISYPTLAELFPSISVKSQLARQEVFIKTERGLRILGAFVNQQKNIHAPAFFLPVSAHETTAFSLLRMKVRALVVFFRNSPVRFKVWKRSTRYTAWSFVFGTNFAPGVPCNRRKVLLIHRKLCRPLRFSGHRNGPWKGSIKDFLSQVQLWKTQWSRCQHCTLMKVLLQAKFWNELVTLTFSA